MSAPASPLETTVMFHVGPVPITQPVVTTWILMAVLVGVAALSTRRLSLRPGRWQAVLEVVVHTLESQISETIQAPGRTYLPLLGTLFLLVLTCNLSGLLPGVRAPTAHLETTGALAAIIFLSVHVYGVRRKGLLGYLRGFAKPTVLMLPLNIVSEITRTVSLMIRLFGNIMSGEFIIAIVVSLAGLFVPIPLMALELLTGVIQAYIFTVLATVFIGAAVGDIEGG